MIAYKSMSYWDAYKLPVPFRKWLIHRYNKHVKEEEKRRNGQASSADEPMTKAERMKMIQQASQVSNDPSRISQMMNSPVRNRK